MNAIYEANNLSKFHMDEFIYADIDVNYRDLRLVERNLPTYVNYDEQIFYWREGKLLRDYYENGMIKTDEFMYIHLQKRKMDTPTFDLDKVNAFYIINGEFLEKYEETKKEVFKLNLRNDVDIPPILAGGQYKKDLRFYWLGRRWMNFKVDFKMMIKRILNI